MCLFVLYSKSLFQVERRWKDVNPVQFKCRDDVIRLNNFRNGAPRYRKVTKEKSAQHMEIFEILL